MGVDDSGYSSSLASRERLQPSGACTEGVYDGKWISVAGYLTVTLLSILQLYVYMYACRMAYVICHADEVAPE